MSALDLALARPPPPTHDEPLPSLPPLVLAPMVRLGTLPLRLLALQRGAALVYTEELTDHKLASARRVADARLGTTDWLGADGRKILQTCPAERGRLVVQLGTGEPRGAVAACANLFDVGDPMRDGIVAVDVNMGCPKRCALAGRTGSAIFSTEGDGGGAWAGNGGAGEGGTEKGTEGGAEGDEAGEENTPVVGETVGETVGGVEGGDPSPGKDARAVAVVQALRAFLPAEIAVTCKLRLHEEGVAATVDRCTRLIAAGVSAIAIHGRRATERERDPVRWAELGEVVRSLTPALNADRGVTGGAVGRGTVEGEGEGGGVEEARSGGRCHIIVNGDILDAGAARALLKQTGPGCAAIMVGRGALLSNNGLFGECDAGGDGGGAAAVGAGAADSTGMGAGAIAVGGVGGMCVTG